MCSDLDNSSVDKYDDLIGQFGGRNAVGNDDGGAAAHDALQAVENIVFGFCVDGGKRVVKHQYFRLPYNGPRNGNPLLLSTGKRDTSLADPCFKTLWKSADVVVDIGVFCCLVDASLLRVRESEADVVVDGVAEKEDVLRHVSHLASEAVEVVV